MKKSILAMTLVAMSVTFSIAAGANGNKTKSQRDYTRIISLIYDTAHECYSEKKLDECDKLDRIEQTLITWCSQKYQQACKTLGVLRNVVAIENLPTH